MALAYGFVKAKITSAPSLKPKELPDEIQYHLHFSLDVAGEKWDAAVNVGTDKESDLLRYKLVQGFDHPLTETLRDAPAGAKDLTDARALPALDFLRSDILKDTGEWVDSEAIHGDNRQEPVATLSALLMLAFESQNDIYVFGRFYAEGNGIHDVHMNQGSSGRFIHRAGNDSNDHDDIWQDGGLFIDFGDRWATYFSAFTQQTVPTDELGNPVPGGHEI